MTIKRMALAIGAAFLVSQILAIAIHGFLLASDYEPFYGTLLRPMNQATWQVMLLPLSHLAFVSALVWVFSRVDLEGSTSARGVKIGVLGWLIGQVPLWLLWYAEQPWPDTLVLKQLGYELASSIVIGLTIAAVSGSTLRRARALSAAT
jgi:MFS superfamily sulfate permease-like transporter